MGIPMGHKPYARLKPRLPDPAEAHCEDLQIVRGEKGPAPVGPAPLFSVYARCLASTPSRNSRPYLASVSLVGMPFSQPRNSYAA